ncbi:MAG: RND transporter [bacterium]|nr:RND transporter [bacterium]
MEKFLSDLPWGLAIIACLTLGLAPFNPPHLVEKLRMLAEGRLVRPLDWFDLVLHSLPWALLLLKALYALKK